MITTVKNKQVSHDEQLLNDEEALKVLNRILATYPDAKGELNWDNVSHLVCAVAISAQTIDETVDRITPKLFSDYPIPADMVQADIKDLEADISKIGLFRSKAKYLKEMAQILIENFDGEVPKDKKLLMALPGVGEKTANIVSAEVYGVPAIAVDTHVTRISKKFKIVPENAKPHEIEERLGEILSKEQWMKTHYAMIFFGRYTMPARAKDPNPYNYLKQ